MGDAKHPEHRAHLLGGGSAGTVAVRAGAAELLSSRTIAIGANVAEFLISFRKVFIAQRPVSGAAWCARAGPGSTTAADLHAQRARKMKVKRGEGALGVYVAY